MAASTAAKAAKELSALKVRALFDIWAFAELIGFKGGPANFGDLHREIAAFITMSLTDDQIDHRRSLVLAPRGHLKSSIISVLYVLWRIYRNPNIRILVGTNLKRLARSFIRELRAYLENNDLKNQVWNARPHISGKLIPALSAAERRAYRARRYGAKEDNTDNYTETEAEDTKVLWSMEAIQVNRPRTVREPTVQCVSTGTLVTGDHYDLVILDDVVDNTNSDSRIKGEALIEWTSDLESVLDPRYHEVFEFGDYVLEDSLGDEMITCGTRYYAWDYYAYLLENATDLGLRVLHRNIYKNGLDDTDGYTWPEKFNKTVIELIRKRLNNYRRFASQYLNTIIATEDNLFHRSNLRTFNANNPVKRDDGSILVTRGMGEKDLIIKHPCIAIDPAASQARGADNSCIIVGGYAETGEFVVLACEIGKLTLTRLCTTTLNLYREWQCRRVIIETVGGFTAYKDALSERFREAGQPLVLIPYVPRGEKHARIEAQLEPLLSDKSFYICHTVLLKNEVQDEVEQGLSSAHDDFWDTCAILRENAQRRRHRQDRRQAPGDTIKRPMSDFNRKYGGFR